MVFVCGIIMVIFFVDIDGVKNWFVENYYGWCCYYFNNNVFGLFFGVKVFF